MGKGVIREGCPALEIDELSAWLWGLRRLLWQGTTNSYTERLHMPALLLEGWQAIDHEIERIHQEG